MNLCQARGRTIGTRGRSLKSRTDGPKKHRHCHQSFIQRPRRRPRPATRKTTHARNALEFMVSMRFGLLAWVSLIHAAGIYLFTRGFLLTRLSLSDFSSCSDCHEVATHKRAILLIIDSLRFDFTTPNPPNPPSSVHHGILTLPREITAKYPKHSFIFNAYADPPTATLQRIKGLTTGSLPTFVDIGNNFGGSSIAEDSILKQLKMAGRKVRSLFIIQAIQSL